MAIFDLFKKDIFKKGKEKERYQRKNKARLLEHEKEEEKKAQGGKLAGDESKETLRTSDIASAVLIQTHITEKSASFSEGGMYTFRIYPKATKSMVKKSIEDLYGVKVKKVNIIKTGPKAVFLQGKYGERPSYKKAVVFLEKGNKIDFV